MDSEQQVKQSNKFVVSDNPGLHYQTLEEMESRLFGYHRNNNKEQDI